MELIQPIHGDTRQPADISEGSVLPSERAAQNAVAVEDFQHQLPFHYQALLDHLTEAVFFKNRDSILVSVNTSMAVKLGKTPQELLGTTDYDLHARDLAEKYRADDLRVMAQRKSESIEEIIVSGGKVRIIETLKSPVFDHDGNVIGIMGIFNDVTDRKRTVEELKRSEVIFRTVWEDSLDAMRMTDDEGTILMINPAFCRLVKMSAEELVGKPFTCIYEEAHQASALDKHQKRFAERDVKPLFERELALWNGDKVWFELSNSFLDIPNERPRLLSIFRDVSERKIAEAKLRDFTTLLERSNRELQDFAYVASHDLQEPLRKVSVFGDRLKTKFGEALGEEGRDYLARMQKAALRMSILINDLLTFSRVTSKSQPFVSVDLNKVVHEVLFDLETRIEQAGGKVEVTALPIIDAEPLHMRQLLQNLIGNALKFHKPDEKPIVKIQSRLIHEPNETDGHRTRDVLELTVSDNGIGFDEKYLDRIFHVFQRLHSRSDYEGTGMGLAITRKIVEHHGGQVTARSKPGEGSTFIVTLPVKQKKPEAIL